ncbi:MAG: hypothetical protein ACTSPE_01330 [Candidatus Thorarchaeota archaeon]|nr:MAG: hypothetical protein DRO73_04115 [Candidatus Thorarchaeota archaeon]
MAQVTCPRCGSTDVALVKRELLSGGGFRKTYRCPRCSKIWDVRE